MRTTRRALAVTVTLSAGLLAACGTAAGDQATTPAPGATISITDSQDRAVQVPVDPATVVALDWGVIRTLSDLGVTVDAVPAPIGTLPDDLATYAAGNEIAQVGTVFEPDYEAIAALEPDLVIVGSRSGTPEVVAEFEKFAPVVDLTVRAEDQAQIVDATRERVEQLGAIFDRQDQAVALMDDVDAGIAEVRSQVEAIPTSAMVVQVSDGTVAAYGPGSRFGLVFTVFGYEPTAAPLDSDGGHGEEISQEFFVQYNPGALFVLDRAKAIGQDQTPALDILDGGMVGTTDAATNDRIVEIDGFSWYLAPSAPSSWQRITADVRGSL